MTHLKKILVPIDGSPASVEALWRAVTLAEDVGATVAVLHVDAPDQFEVGSGTSTAPGARQQADRQMDEAIQGARSKLGDRLSSRRVSGDPVRRILEAAANEEIDLIAIGTQGRVGRLHALVGSVAEAVVRSSSCPVMTVRQPDGEEESFSERIHGRQQLAEQARPHR
ncbi:MAG TPA: universal stress protein [Polyangiaceae bacterium]|nr:universal stress protein [Polyangiaceae bacterium]